MENKGKEKYIFIGTIVLLTIIVSHLFSIPSVEDLIAKKYETIYDLQCDTSSFSDDDIYPCKQADGRIGLFKITSAEYSSNIATIGSSSTPLGVEELKSRGLSPKPYSTN